jgi:hypothetical protein
VEQQTVAKSFKKHEISNACDHPENLMFEKSGITTASVIIVITLWESMTHTKLRIALPFCQVSICEFGVQCW